MNCALCGRPLPRDTRWAITRMLNPRPPVCLTDLEPCYLGLRERLGLRNAITEEEVALVVRRRERRGR